MGAVADIFYLRILLFMAWFVNSVPFELPKLHSEPGMLRVCRVTKCTDRSYYPGCAG